MARRSALNRGASRGAAFAPVLVAGFGLIVASTAQAMPRHALLAPDDKVGTSQIAVIEPPIAVPKEAPCVVPLYAGAQFGGDTVPIAYTPPADCPGPWAKVVLKVDISLDKGIQYDRSGTIFLGGVPLWFGTTSEPSPRLAPKWHVERDLTDYTALLKATQTGYVLIANYTNDQDTSIITSSAQLLFYPANANYPAPRTPDMVVALAPAGGGTVALNTSSDMLTITPTLPQNIVAASLDVYLQGQSGDEFWYTCVPNDLAGPLEECGGGSFREGQISIDGTPAGVAPVFPWIFTGGIDPYLWIPIPGVQTLNFKPFRVELSPFAGALDVAGTHSISLSVAGANSYFSVTGAMFLYTDPGAAIVTGAVTGNSLTAAPTPIVVNDTVTNNGVTTGNLKTHARHDFRIEGYVQTSTGKVVNTVSQTGSFKNNQIFDITDSIYKQKILQHTDTTVVATSKGAVSGSETRTYAYPLILGFDQVFSDAGGKQVAPVNQQYLATTLTQKDGQPAISTTIQDAIQTTDTLLFNSQFQITGHKKQSSTATYITTGPDGCFKRTLAAVDNTLTADTTGCN